MRTKGRKLVTCYIAVTEYVTGKRVGVRREGLTPQEQGAEVICSST